MKLKNIKVRYLFENDVVKNLKFTYYLEKRWIVIYDL